MKFNGRILISIIVALTIIFSVGWSLNMKTISNSLENPIKFGLAAAPYSMDPIEYDPAIHHITMRPVLGSLVSQYKSGTIIGQIAESWSNSDDLSTWTFFIRPGLTFSNGDPITAETVRLALTRIAFLQHQRGSASGFTEHLRDLNKLGSASERFVGIESIDNEVILKFVRPQPKLLETISFGLYAIAHPNDFDPNSGRWRDPKSAIASGSYKLREWTGESLVIERRDDLPDFMARADSPSLVKFIWGPGQISQVDIMMGSSFDSEQFRGMEYFGSGATMASIYYVDLISWNHPESPLRDINLRKRLRSAFYERLDLIRETRPYGFLPVATSKPQVSSTDQRDYKATDDHKLSLTIPEPRNNSIFSNKLYQAITLGLEAAGVTVESVPRPEPKEIGAMLDPNSPNYPVHLTTFATGILVEDPISDVKFMINSKEGIRLPDPTGRLKQEAAKERPDLGKINDILWDDAIIWPVAHYSMGLWAKESMFDFSQVNLSLPPTDISWIGLK